jgi:hypothetical protein
VLETDPNHGRCIIENCDPSRIEYGHIVARRDYKDRNLVRRGSGSGTHEDRHHHRLREVTRMVLESAPVL